MDILKVSVFGITAVLMALILKGCRPEYSYYVSIAVCICIFLLVANKLELIIGYARKMQSFIQLDDAYMAMILKMIGVTYIAEFAADICRDAGYGAIAGQIGVFSKLSILAVSMPIITALLETIRGFLGT